MTWTNQADVSAYHPWTHLEKITFEQSFVFKHYIFSFENCYLGQKRRSKGQGDILKTLSWETETFSEQSKT